MPAVRVTSWCCAFERSRITSVFKVGDTADVPIPTAIPVRAEPSPEYEVAVTVPDTLMFCKNVALVLVLMLSVEATPVRPEPSPLKELAVTIPAVKILSWLIVVALPIFRSPPLTVTPFLAVIRPTESTFVTSS